MLLGVAGLGYWYRYRNSTDILPDILGLICGGIAIQAGIVWFLAIAFDARRYKRLMNGTTVLTRWFVTPDEWHAFVIHNHALGESGKAHRFGIPRAHVARTDPVEVIVGVDGAMIDGDFHPLPRKGVTYVSRPVWRDGTPPYLEFHLQEPGAHDSTPSDFAVRIPIGARAHAQAREVLDYYTNR
jgi:hypothetical protein